MLHTRWSAEAWAQVRVEFRRALALRSEIRRAGWFIHENASGVKVVLSWCPPGSSVRQSSIRARSRMTSYTIVGDPSRQRWAFQSTSRSCRTINHPGTPDWNVCPRALCLPTPPARDPVGIGRDARPRRRNSS
jgi:hypothetical protein